MIYDIVVPDAARMIQFEREEPQLPLAWFVTGEVAKRVKEEIDRKYWLENGAEHNVQRLCAALAAISNVPSYQYHVLKECITRLEERPAFPLYSINVFASFSPL